MKYSSLAPLRWLSALATAAALAACGGGGGGGGDGDGGVVQPPAADARNGDYAMYAADARQYTLSLDFDARTYRVTGNGQDIQGSFAARAAGDFEFDTDGTVIPAPGAPRFNTLADAMVGSVRLPTGAVPFVAARAFATTLADAAGTYNFLSSTRDPAAASNSAIFAGELLATGKLRTCNDNQIFTIAACPAASVVEANVTVAGNVFTADLGAAGTYAFRVAKIGNDRVFLRSGPTSTAVRRLTVGMVSSAFVNGTFKGYNTNAQATTTWLDGAYNANWTDSTGNYVRMGTMVTAGLPAGLVGITSGDGNFFAMGNGSVFMLVSARGNPNLPGYVEFGKR